jgi:hypothetical protein
VTKLDPSAIAAEFQSDKLRDARLTARLQKIISTIAAAPDQSFPTVFDDAAGLEGFYRFINNTRVKPAQVVKPHFDQTLARMSALDSVFIVHDTTQFAFSGETDRKGLSTTGRRTQGFSGHFALAVSPEKREPLGIVGYSTHFRQARPRKLSRRAHHRSQDNEARRWNDLVDEVEQRAKASKCTSRLVHVMDREADSYALMATLVEQGQRFIIRMTQDRWVVADEAKSKASEAIAKMPVMLTREVKLSRRSYNRKELATEKMKKIHPARAQRMALLGVQAMTLELPRSDYIAREFPRSIVVNLVWVEEQNPPEGEEPIRWKLMTTEPIQTAEDVEAIVDGYRARWRVEEFFKALKTGCSYEQRQMETAGSLLNVLAISIPIAASLLRLRDLAADESVLAEEVFDEQECAALRAMVLERQHIRLPQELTLDRALRAIARFGGYIKKKERPGWQTLWRGYSEWQMFVAGWRAAGAQKSITYGSDRT